MELPTLRERVLALRKADPRVSVRVMSDMLGCTTERVRQILGEADLPKRVDIFDPLCPVCSAPASTHFRGQMCSVVVGD
jgi:hypothetical protein